MPEPLLQANSLRIQFCVEIAIVLDPVAVCSGIVQPVKPPT